MRPRLKIEVPALDPYEVEVEEGLNKVGRAIDNTIGLRDMNVSRYHFHIRCEGKVCTLEDLGSRNGTTVNGRRVKEKRLAEGDRITVGSSVLTFCEAPLTESQDGVDPRLFEPLPPGAPTPTPDAAPRVLGGDVVPGQIGRATHGQGFPRPQAELPEPSRSATESSIDFSAEVPQKQTSLFDGGKVLTSSTDKKRWQHLAEVASIIGTEHDLNTLLHSIVDALLQLVPSRGAFLVLIKEDQRFQLEVARNLQAQDVASGQGRYRLSTSICYQAARENRAILTESAQEDDELAAYRSIASLNIESVLCMPFGVRDKVLGVVYLDNPRVTSFVGKEEELLEVVTAFGSLAGVAVWNAQLLASTRQQERIEQELRIAARIQRSLLPRQAPAVDGYELDGRSSPAKEIGGDLYDFLVRKESFGDVLIGIGDVSGKGVGAGLVGSSTRSLLHAYGPITERTDEILIAANRVLAEDLEPGIFVSFVLMRLKPETGEVHFTGAGHEHIVVYRAATKSCEKIKAGGVVMGLTSDLSGRLEELPLALEPGDQVVLYTDGATEATDDTGEEFGLHRVGQVVLQHGERPPHEVVQRLFEAVTTFHGRDNEQEDDLTIVAFRRKP